MAFDPSGVLYVGEFGSHDIVKLPGGAKTAFSHDDTFIGGLAFGPAGDLYDGGLNAANNPIYKFDGAGNRTVFVSGNYTDALAFDSKGNLFAADPPDHLILKITPNGTTTTFAMNITPAGIAFDAAGNLFAIDIATNSIFKVHAVRDYNHVCWARYGV